MSDKSASTNAGKLTFFFSLLQKFCAKRNNCRYLFPQLTQFEIIFCGEKEVGGAFKLSLFVSLSTPLLYP